jgi:hypothetical protein
MLFGYVHEMVVPAVSIYSQTSIHRFHQEPEKETMDQGKQ